MQSKTMEVLGIETSCDDTCVAIVNDENQIKANLSFSQTKQHSRFSGVVPEIAARLHNEKLPILLDQISKITPINNVSAVAATSGPGLIGGLITGTTFAKTVASILKIPFIAVNHLEAHILVAQLTNVQIKYPILTLLISGGHCQFICTASLSHHKLIGSTLDDALGESFDKLAVMLGLPYPGGPEIEKHALLGDENAYKFPRPMIQSGCANFSFSGLKTHIKILLSKKSSITQQDKCNICASFQKAVLDIINKKISIAANAFFKLTDAKSACHFILSGGVAANVYLRKGIQRYIANHHDFTFYAPPLDLCTDNAVMVAYTGLKYLKAGVHHGMNFQPKSKWYLHTLKM